MLSYTSLPAVSARLRLRSLCAARATGQVPVRGIVVADIRDLP